MTDDEKESYPNYKTTDGYLKTISYKEAWKKSFNHVIQKLEIEKLLALPNFDYKVFNEISGISKKDIEKKQEEVDGE